MNLSTRLSALLFASVVTSVVHAQISITDDQNSVGASASATNGSWMNLSVSHSHSSSLIANYNRMRGASIAQDPFYAYPTGRATSTFDAYNINMSGEAQADANTNDTSSMPGPSLYASGGAYSSITFGVATTQTYHFSASMYRYDHGFNGYIELLEDGNQIAYLDVFSGSLDTDFVLSSGSTYVLTSTASAGASVYDSYQFSAATVGYEAHLSTVPEPVSMLVLLPSALAVINRARKVR